MNPLRRRRGDPPPSSPAAVLLASDGRASFSDAAVDAAAAAVAPGERVGVLTIARVYGFTLGMQHPGLMPTRAELEERRDWVSAAIDRLEAKGVDADGQVTVTRRHARTIADAARRRTARLVLVDQAASGPMRRLIEGEVSRSVGRRLGRSGVDVHVVRDG